MQTRLSRTAKLIVAVLGTLAAGSLAFGQSLWVPTHTQALTTLTSATDLGATPSSQPVTVRVVLAMPNQQAVVSYVREVNTPGNAKYGQRLTPAQFKASYAPSASQVAAVQSYLAGAGLSGITVEPNNLIVSATGTAAQVSSAFNTRLENFSQNGSTVFANVTPAMVPLSLGSTVAAVLGLNTAGKFHSELVTRANATPAALPTGLPSVPQYLVSYNPQNFWEIYGVGNTPQATKASIAIITEGDMTGVLSDLRTEESANGLPAVPVSVIQVGLASPDVSGADEWDMDTQYSTGMAGNVGHLYLYTTTSLSDSDLTLDISHFITDDIAQAASASLGECEIFPYLDGTTIAIDQLLLEGAAQGQSFFASSGDTGGFCPAGPAGENGVPAGAPLVQYPAASTYAMGVGGTTLLTNADGSYDLETAWYSGGGGISQFENTNYWQTAAGIVASKDSAKGVPDMALDADPESGANVYVNGAPEGVGGTSLSSPLALGVWARLISQNPKLGFAPVALYSLYSGSSTPGTYPAGGYNDITLGTNVPWVATPGWDFTTGLGTPIVSELSADLAQ